MKNTAKVKDSVKEKKVHPSNDHTGSDCDSDHTGKDGSSDHSDGDCDNDETETTEKKGKSKGKLALILPELILKQIKQKVNND